jgi:hypothetical protein
MSGLDGPARRGTASRQLQTEPGASFVANAVAGRPAGRGRMRSSAEARLPRVGGNRFAGLRCACCDKSRAPLSTDCPIPQALGLRRGPRSIPATMRKNLTGSPLM